jgi:cytochrome c-type biogenesis protein CcmE
MKPKTLIGLVLMIGFAALLLLNFSEQVGGYMNFTEAEATGAKAHVVGQWAQDQPLRYDPQRNLFSFYMVDGAGHMRQVHYPHPKPANFEDAEKLVVEGQMQDDVFVANHILVKCPSKYNDGRNLEEAAAS